MGRLSRPEAGVHQSGDRRLRNANDRHVHPVAAERFSHRALSLDGRNRVCLIEGRGRSQIGDRTFEWGSRDIFVVPSWHWVAHEADEEAVLFSFSDRPVQQKLDLFREDRGNA